MKNEALARQEDAPVARAAQYALLPKVDVWETENAFHVQAELPGVSEKSVDVKIEDGVLTILGRVEPEELAGFSRLYAEYEPGNFERSFRLAEAIDPEQTSAVVTNGLLTLTLPKREAAKPRRIPIKAA